MLSCGHSLPYVINDLLVRKIYDSLKLWHKSHSEIYDMTIDPLTAPKSIPETSMEDFYQYVMLLKKKDLEIFRNVLMILKEHPDANVYDYIRCSIDNSRDEYKDIETHVKKLYKKNNLVYNADANPFI